MRARAMIIVSAVGLSVAMAGNAEARRLPGLLGAVIGTVGGLVGLHHRHHHVAHAAPHHASRVAARSPENVGARTEQPISEGNAAAGGQTVSAGQTVWPRLPADLADYVFWPSGNDDPFWSYGYAEVIAGALRPESRHGERNPARRKPPATAVASATGGAPSTCLGQQGTEVANGVIERIEQTIAPNDSQQSPLADLRDAVRHGFEYFDSACPTDRPQSPSSRLDAMEDRLWAARQALLVIRAPLDTLYASLTDEQRARLNGPTPQSAEREATCAQGAPELPLTQFERGARPSADQRAGLEALKTTSATLAKMLASSCPSGMPTTPVARLDAADKRLNELLYAVVTLRAPLEGYYASVNDAQKSRVKANR